MGPETPTREGFTVRLDGLGEARLDRVDGFRYEAVKGAVANELPGTVPEEVKEERRHRFVVAQPVAGALHGLAMMSVLGRRARI